MGEEDAVVVRSVRNESKASVKDLADMVVALSDPTAPPPNEQQALAYTSYINTLYRNFKVTTCSYI